MLAALAVLWRFRPERPDLPNSLSSPVTTAMLQQLAFIVAWLLGALAILLVLASALRLLLARRRQPPRALLAGAMPVSRDRSLRQSRLAARSSERRAFSPPFPLILRAYPTSNGEVEHTRVPDREALLAATLPAESPTTHARQPRDGPRPPSIALLGPLEIAASKPRRRGFRSHTQQLLAYLALHREGATPDELIAALWPDVHDGKARKRLWDSVSDARAHLGECILRANERYVLDREAVAIDLDQFEELLTRAHAVCGSDREQLLERALALVRAQPLAGTDSTNSPTSAWRMATLRVRWPPRSRRSRSIRTTRPLTRSPCTPSRSSGSGRRSSGVTSGSARNSTRASGSNRSTKHESSTGAFSARTAEMRGGTCRRAPAAPEGSRC